MRAWDLRPLGIALAGAMWLLSSPALAGELEDFQAARAAYDTHDFPAAITLFEALVGGPAPRLESESLILESRKYLGAAYLIVGRREAAEEQFELLLTADPTYEIAAADFPTPVVELFAAVRDDLAERARIERELETAARNHEHDVEVIRALVDFAQEEVEIEMFNSRWIAAIPFGVGQFQNGDDGLGAFFLVSEAVLVLGMGGTLAGYLYVLSTADDRPPPRTPEEADRILTGLEIANWSSLAAFATVAIAGVIEAQLNFRATHVVRRRRVVPPELLEGVDLSVGLGTFRLTVSF